MMSQKTPPHPWHEGQPYGRPQHSRNPFEEGRIEGSVISADATAAPHKNNIRKPSHQRHHRHSCRSNVGSAAITPAKPNRSSRLWQLPEESIAGYAQWIQDKPEAEQTPSERRFLWKYLMRYLGLKRNDRKTRQFVEELQSKINRTAMEETFLQQYHKRRNDRKSNNKSDAISRTTTKDSSDDAVIVWERSTHHQKNKGHQKSSDSTLDCPSTSLKGLRESMERMGLSLEQLKEPVAEEGDQMRGFF